MSPIPPRDDPFPELSPDLLKYAAHTVDLDGIARQVEVRNTVEAQNGLRCTCGRRIRHGGIEAFGIYIGPVPAQLTGGLPIPDGNIKLTAWFCSSDCDSFKEAIREGIMWDGVLLCGMDRIPVAGTILMRPIRWADEHPETGVGGHDRSG